MSRLLTSNGNLSLPYRMSSINNSFERLEMSQGGKIAFSSAYFKCIMPRNIITALHIPQAQESRLD